jgi:hypothetical protein
MSDTDEDDDLPVPAGALTHTAWAPYFMYGPRARRKFSEWVKVGRGRFETDSEGNQIAHVYINATVRGDTGYIRLMPAGKKPPPPTATPQQQPKRPQEDE